MAEHIIEVRVDEKIASVVGDPLYVCGNSDYIVKFHFDAEWAGHETKTARFIKSNKEYIDVLFSGDQCAVPIIDNTPYVRIGVYAGNLCTTTAAIVNAQRSILCGSGVPADPDPDIYTQMLERFDELFQRDVKTDSEKLGGKPASDYALKSETAPASHVTDKNNPHGVNAAQIGAAPSGYGLGQLQSTPYLDDCNKHVGNGWYRFDENTLNKPENATIGAVFVKSAQAYSGAYIQYQTMTNGYWEARRMYGPWDGLWTEWEFVNPPMNAGVEYRTTERYWGKPVYCKLVDCGALPNESTKLVYYADNGVVNHIVRYSGEMFASGDTFSMPYTMNGVEVCVQAIGRTGINLYASYNASGFAAYVTVWYIKNE